MSDDEELVEEPRTVRPYTLTRGRTRARQGVLPLEALVRATGTEDTAQTPERRRICAMTGDRILSVAELSAHLGLPLGVIRVLVGDLADEGLVSIHRNDDPQQQTPAAHLKVLESVLDGITAL
jgi:hypothetical protein